MDTTWAALADPHRRRIVELLLDRELAVGDLVAELPIAQSGVSRHLRILREAGLVTARADAQRRLYALAPEPLDAVSDWLARCREIWEARLDGFERELERRRTSRPSNDGGT